MHVRPKSVTLLAVMHFCIQARLKQSRFNARIEMSRKDDRELEIKYVRLKRRKEYCGQHPGPCAGDGRQQIRTATYLEGADWVGFNDMLNDLFDEKEWEADIWSFGQEFRGKMRIRCGRLRRVHYGASGPYGHMAWDAYGMENDFEDWCGRQAPVSRYPEDTPGLASWRPEEAALTKEE
jgi:hypothetical protein